MTIRFYTAVLLLLALATPLFAPPTPGSSLEKWITNEQTRIDRSVDASKIVPPDIANQKEEYRPDSQNWFDLPSVWVPEQELKVAALEDQIPETLKPELYRIRDGKKEYRLFIHPESKQFYGDLIKKYPLVVEHRATATSSSRSVLVEPIHDPATHYFAKLSLDVNLGGVSRTIPEGEAARSVGATKYFHDHEAKIKSNFANIPEVLGVIPKGMDRGAQLIRLVPPEIEKNETELVPLFSLYAHEGDKPTLLEELAKKARLSPAKFAQEKIVKPFAKGWSDWALKGGLVAEAHAQNVLMEISKDGRATGRFFLRDGGGIYIRPNVAAVEAGELSKLPTFHSFLWDYQKFAADAETSSLQTYFAGGFLFNLDRELKRIDPNYRKGSVENWMWSETASQISAQSGLPKREITRAKMQEDMEGVLRDARERMAGEAYRPISHGLGRPLRIGVYSGTFDPPHEGHVSLVEKARREQGLDIIYITPNMNPPHKPGATPFDIRNQMAKAAFSQIGDVVVDGAMQSAARFQGPDGLIKRLRKDFDPDTQFFRIIGDDSFEYYQTEEGLKATHPQVTFIVGSRGEEKRFPEKVGKSPVEPLPFSDPGFSSTQIRKEIAAGGRPETIDPKVWAIIESRKLYDLPRSGSDCKKPLKVIAVETGR